MGMAVEYKGPGTGGQHLWANGSHLVNAVTPSLEEGVKRFGKRINLHEKTYARSLPFALGYRGENFLPRNVGTRTQELIEHGLGRLKKMLEMEAAPKPVEAPRVTPPAKSAPRPAPKVFDEAPAPEVAPVVPQPPQPPRRPTRAPASGLPPGVRQAVRNQVTAKP